MKSYKITLLLLLLISCTTLENESINKNITADSGSFIKIPLHNELPVGYKINIQNKKYVIYGLPYVLDDEIITVGNYKIKVRKKDFGESRIIIDNQNLVQPKISDRERASAEYLKVRSIINKVTTQFDYNFDFIPPINDVITSNYGKQRFINGSRRNPHKALDIRGGIGTQIFAPKKGRVVLAEEHFYGGNKLILDHGGGLFTAYSHLSKFAVTKGQIVDQSEIIGFVGATGRVTGPHLHWEVFLNEESINPELLVALQNAQD